MFTLVSVCVGGGGRPFCVSLLHLVPLAGFTFSAFVSISHVWRGISVLK